MNEGSVYQVKGKGLDWKYMQTKVLAPEFEQDNDLKELIKSTRENKVKTVFKKRMKRAMKKKLRKNGE